MGQYYTLVNHTKGEKVVAEEMGGYAKFPEWCGGSTAAALPYLLHQSEEAFKDDLEFLGRWVGDDIALLGEYDPAHERTEEYTDISLPLAEEFNLTFGVRYFVSANEQLDRDDLIAEEPPAIPIAIAINNDPCQGYITGKIVLKIAGVEISFDEYEGSVYINHYDGKLQALVHEDASDEPSHIVHMV